MRGRGDRRVGNCSVRVICEGDSFLGVIPPLRE